MKKCLLCILFTIFTLFNLYSLTEPHFIASNKIIEDVKNLDLLKISIDNVTSNGIIVYISETQKNELAKLGYNPIQLFNQARNYVHNPYSTTYQYYTYNQYVDFMYETAQNYPAICSLHIAGHSVENRQILFMKISTNPNENNPKPKVKLTSTIHGDEVVGYDLMIRLIKLLTEEYLINPEITQLVENTEIWINPLTNPDGFVAHERQNANGVDLNRFFPDFLFDNNNTTENREPEIAIMMNFANENKTHLSANFHGGAQVINYPWDTTYDTFPDDDLMISLSLAYADHNPDLYNSTSFPNGITNGAAWYVIHGSMQDWDNYYNQVFHVTAEISNDKWPNPSTLDNFWLNNKTSLINYIKQAHRGFSGIVKNSNEEVLYAKIELNNHLTIYNDPQTGYFNRLLLPGNYNFLISSYGYESLYLDNIVITENEFVFSEVCLEPLPSSNLYGYVFDNQNNLLNNVKIKILNTPLNEIYTDENGYYNFPEVSFGNYDISVNYQSTDYIFNVDIYEANKNYNFIIAEPEFYDDFEVLNNLWTLQGSWHYQNINNNTVLSDSPGNYSNNQNISATLNQEFNISLDSPAVVGFKTSYSLESNYDFVYFEILVNNQWQILDTFTGSSEWVNLSYSINQYVDNIVKFRFRLKTDTSITDTGILIDDFFVNTGSYHVNLFDEPVTSINRMPNLTHYPNPANLNTGINFTTDIKNIKDLKISIYNIKGQKLHDFLIEANTKNTHISLNKLSSMKNFTSGVYFYRYEIDDYKSPTKKLLIIK